MDRPTPPPSDAPPDDPGTTLAEPLLDVVERRSSRPPTPAAADATGPAAEAAAERGAPAEPESTLDVLDDPDLAVLAELGRFRVEAFLGRGGMGRVYRAFDLKLERSVALKLLYLDDAAAARRFLGEARAQARIDHPNVCKVFDVGEVRGRRYIVMQLLEGVSLSAAARSLPIEQTVALVRDACEGVQAAHRIGLVHRDLKTSNILVVREETGLHPYVVDFGLARDITAAGMTQTGHTVGTPWYMAPEQVAGRAIDRRADVYSLGVVLYQLLADRYPIDGTSGIDVMMRVLADEEPTRLREVAPRVPADLDTIVMKCLERDPARRYDSARALADDLGHWLAGEPIVARASGIGYRLAKRVRRQWPLFALGAAAVLALLVGGGFALSERLRAADRARLAERFGAESERLEWMLRAAYQLPLRDVSAVRADVRRQLEELERQLASRSPKAAAPGRTALGRGYLALDDEDRALAELERAWSAGERTPELAGARGLAFARRYERAIEEARRIATEPERKAATADAARRFAEPARAALVLARGAVGVPAKYLEALLAYLDGDFERAVAAAASAAAESPWYYEAALLEAAVRSAEAPAGVDGEALARADGALARAAEIGESDPRTHASRAALAFERMSIAIHSRGDGVEDRFAEGMAACDRALVADPKFPPARRARIAGQSSFAAWELDRDRDAAPGLERALAEAESLAADEPDDADARLTLARVRLVDAKRLRFSGGDSRPVLQAAIADLETARRLGTDDWRVASELGQSASELAVQAEDRGEDPEPLRDRAIVELERAVALAPDLYKVHFELARTWSDRAARDLQRGVAADEAVKRATASYRRALELKPDYPQAENSLGVIHLNRCWYFVDRDRAAARADAEQAIVHFRRAQEIQPTYANARLNSGLAYRALADLDALDGRDPWPALESAVAAFRAGVEINPGIFFAWGEMARLYTQGAIWNLEQGRSPEAALAESNKLLARALAAAPDDYMMLYMKGEAEWAAARWARREKRDARPALGRARDQIERSDRANPKYLANLELAVQVEAEAAEVELEARRDPKPSLARARAFLERARKEQPDRAKHAELEKRLVALEARFQGS